MVRSVASHQSPHCTHIIDQWVLRLDFCCFCSLTGRSHFYDEPLEPALLHDILHRYHGEGYTVTCSSGCYVCWSMFICGLMLVYMIVILSVLCPGGDDHHCGIHSGCLCVPYELQPQEPGTSGEPRGWDRVNLYYLCSWAINMFVILQWPWLKTWFKIRLKQVVDVVCILPEMNVIWCNVLWSDAILNVCSIPSDKMLIWWTFRSRCSVRKRSWPWTGIHLCVHVLDENGIVFEVEVSRDETLATLELYKQTCPGLSSLSSLQGVLQAMDRGGVRTHKHS